MVNERARILSNECVGPKLYVMTVSSPLIASAIEPGEFVHMKVPALEGHILRRPFSVYARDVEAGTLDILYQTVGEATRHMAALAPDPVSGREPVELIGPVGRAWAPPKDARRALLVGGGAGAPAIFMLAESLMAAGVRTDVVLGAQTKDALVCRDRFDHLLASAQAAALGCGQTRCATDDGSFGRAGFCTSLVEEALSEACDEGRGYDYVATCGPEPLMRIVARMAAAADVFCEVSLEKRMACGVGACLSCVVDTVDGKRRSCVDGPVFDASKVVW